MSTAGGGTGSPGRRRRDLEDSRRSETAFLKSRVRVLQKEEEEDKIRGLGRRGVMVSQCSRGLSMGVADEEEDACERDE